MRGTKNPWVVTPLPIVVGSLITYLLAYSTLVLTSAYANRTTIDPWRLLADLGQFLLFGFAWALPLFAVGIITVCIVQYALRRVRSHLLHAVAMAGAVYLVGLLIFFGLDAIWSDASQNSVWQILEGSFQLLATIAAATLVARLLVSRLIKTQSQRATNTPRGEGPSHDNVTS